jgi:DNA-binding transcriptional ArsR family regulator
MDENKEQIKDTQITKPRTRGADLENFVLEKSIFNNVFNKDIQRIYLYKKAERLSKALNLIAPAFRENKPLKDRIDGIAMGIIDASIAPAGFSLEALSRELLALSSILSIARTSGLLSPMNADFISQEAHTLLQEAASYEEPRLSLEEVPSVAQLARTSVQSRTPALQKAPFPQSRTLKTNSPIPSTTQVYKGHIKDVKDMNGDRRGAILAILKAKSPSYIKDISTLIRNVSEKTIQRELQALVVEGIVTKAGERRWTQYSLS